MATKTEITNLALGHLGTGKEIANFDTENSAEAKAARRFFDISVQKTQRDFYWPFTRKIEALQLVEEQPNNEWAYSYRYPSRCERFIKIQSGARNDNRQSRVPYLLAQDDAGKLIFTDYNNAIGEYAQLITTTAIFPSDYTLALSAWLAFMMIPQISKGDPFGFRQTTSQLYLSLLGQARENSKNEEQKEEEPLSELQRARF